MTALTQVPSAAALGAPSGRANLVNVGRLVRVTAAGTVGQALLAEDGAGALTGLLSAAASSSAGGSLLASNGTLCLSWGAGNGAGVSTADGLTVNGALTVASGAAVTGTVTAIAAATQDAVRMQGRAGGTGSYVATITPTTLTGSRTQTLPDLTGTFALTGASQNVTFGTLSSTALTSTGGVAVGGALTGATTGAFSTSIVIGGATSAGVGVLQINQTVDTISGGILLETTDNTINGGFFATTSGLVTRFGGVSGFRCAQNTTEVLHTTASTSTTTGALTVAGGVGIAGSLFGARATFAGTDAGSVSASQTTIGGGVIRTAGNAIVGSVFAGNVQIAAVSGYNTISMNGAGSLTSATTIYSLGSDQTLYLNVPTGNTVRARVNGTDVLTCGSSDITIGSGVGLKLGNAYTAGAPTPTGYIVIKDSAGTSYKIPAEAL